VLPDVAQRVLAAGHRHLAVDRHGFRAVILGGVDQKTQICLHRPAFKDHDRTFDPGVLVAGRCEQLGDGLLGDRLVDDDTDRAVLVMLQQ